MPGILPMKMIRVGSATSSRIAQACDRCRSKKIRCDGIRPCCTQCSSVGFECKTSDKLSRRAFPRGYTESLEDRVRGLEAEVRELKQLLDEKDEKIDMLSRLHSFSAPSRKGSSSLSPGIAAQIKVEVESSRDDTFHVEIPAPVQLGAPTTGNSTTSSFIEAFEQKIQEHDKRPQNISAPSLLSEQPAPRSSSSSARTPPRIMSDQYINLFFQEWQPLLPILHRPTFLRVYEQYLAGPDAGNWQSNKHAIAQLFLIFEISALSSTGPQKAAAPSYESQWRRALFSTSSAPSVATVQCQLLAQLCYLLRADYTHLSRHRGIAVGMIHELGLHQGHRYQNLSTYECETRKRVFWCQYVLDKFASASTGTPTLLREDDISTDYPADVDDENLNTQGFSPSLPGELTKISSALALFKAARILSKTLEHLYPAKASYQLSMSKLHALSDELDQWSEELPEHLRLRFCNDKPATNLISCRSPILSLTYFYIRGLIHRPLLCHGSGSPCSAATIVLATAGKHILQILDLLDERRMNYTFPLHRRALLLTAGFSVLWQSIDLDHESKLIKDNQKSLSLVLTMLARENSVSAIEFQRIVTAFMPIEGRRQLSPKHINIDSPAAKLLSSMPAPGAKDAARSTKKQLQAIASRFSSFKHTSRPEETRRATVPATGSHPYSPQPRPGSTASLSSTRSAPVMNLSTPSPLSHPRNLTGQSAINLDYFPIGEELGDNSMTSASSSTMLPPRKPMQASPTIANASWDNLMHTFDPGNALFGTPNGQSSHMPGSEWLSESSWDLPSMDYASKANVPQSLLSFSGDSMASGEDLVFSASSNNGSTSTNESIEVGRDAFKGITIPVDDGFDFDEVTAAA